jgi:hypothetical protein
VAHLHHANHDFRQLIVTPAFDYKCARAHSPIVVVSQICHALFEQIRERVQADVEFHAIMRWEVAEETGNLIALDEYGFAITPRDVAWAS